MTTKQSNEQIIKEYPIQDDIWPSRRWNADMTEYCDLSGEDNSTTGEQEVKSLHTLGKWKFDNSDYIPDVYGCEVSEISVPGQWIAYVRGDSKGIREANAAHIVKCVNSYDKLDRMVADLVGNVHDLKDIMEQDNFKHKKEKEQLVKALLDLIKVSETTTQNLVGFDGAYELDSSIDRARDILAKL